jgi:geranylgeranyl diphosphate synthase type II
MPTDGEQFARYLDRAARRVDETLERQLPKTTKRPRVIHKAMRYTTLSEGKRLRPALVLLAYETAGGRGRRADPVAAAVEMVHAFSLIHDDLPAMDDDDFRRGKPTSHKVFGEGVAILAGDALLALAFQTLSEQSRKSALGPVVTANLVEELSAATGSGGVIGGQVLDLLSEGDDVTRSTVDYIHRHKTARLFSASLRLGALAAQAKPATLGRLTRFGEAVGTAFQIVDDILGATGSFRELGRDPGRDQARGKVTYPRVVGFDSSHRAVDRLLRRGRKEVDPFADHRHLYRGFLDLVDRRRRDAQGKLLAPRGEP